ncbi:hypothetical protein ACFO9E_12705 [Streptomyces maoxianensis]|uniref:Uncharacterized protein n=1 Tax=Streptomyces maoxianensis TaxID=1459942 RepID=A0ABV9G6H0_9ACTN
MGADKWRARNRAEVYLARHKAAKEGLGLLSTAVKALPAGASDTEVRQLVMNHWLDVEAAKETWRRLQGTVTEGLTENHMTLFTSGGLESYATLMEEVYEACDGFLNNSPSWDASSLVHFLDFIVLVNFQVIDD